MIIESRELLASGVYKVTSSNKSVFLIRSDYLKQVSSEDFLVRDDFDENETDDILEAGLITAVEYKAVSYLSRSEQCRFGLYKKLLEKGFEKSRIDCALDFLQNKNYLSDERYARSWLNTRKINHFEGRTKLQAELMNRGLDRETVKIALDEFFTENDEDEIAVRAFEKLRRKGKTSDKLISAMINAGFSYKTASELLKGAN